MNYKKEYGKKILVLIRFVIYSYFSLIPEQ